MPSAVEISNCGGGLNSSPRLNLSVPTVVEGWYDLLEQMLLLTICIKRGLEIAKQQNDQLGFTHY